jgi:hypothetical protein
VLKYKEEGNVSVLGDTLREKGEWPITATEGEKKDRIFPSQWKLRFPRMDFFPGLKSWRFESNMTVALRFLSAFKLG